MLENEMQPPSVTQIHKLIIEAVCSFIDNMIIIFDLQGLKIGGGNHRVSDLGPSNKFPPQKGQNDCKELLMLSWKPLLVCL